jgi:hypothetical protein
MKRESFTRNENIALLLGGEGEGGKGGKGISLKNDSWRRCARRERAAKRFDERLFEKMVCQQSNVPKKLGGELHDNLMEEDVGSEREIMSGDGDEIDGECWNRFCGGCGGGFVTMSRVWENVLSSLAKVQKCKCETHQRFNGREG